MPMNHITCMYDGVQCRAHARLSDLLVRFARCYLFTKTLELSADTQFCRLCAASEVGTHGCHAAQQPAAMPRQREGTVLNR